MFFWQTFFLSIFALFNLGVFIKAFYETKYKQNVFGLTRPLVIIGAFVWGDALVFGLFWFLVSGLTVWLQDWTLFLLISAVFWVVRSWGEVIYWLNQQFSTLNRNPIETLPGRAIFHNDSIWFIHQIVWQCLAVIFTVLAIYFAGVWLRTIL